MNESPASHWDDFVGSWRGVLTASLAIVATACLLLGLLDTASEPSRVVEASQLGLAVIALAAFTQLYSDGHAGATS